MEYIDDDNITGASDDDDDDNPSSPGSAYDDGNLINVAMENEVTAQLVAAGVVGVAAAAAITSSKKKKRPHSFETNPSIRKRQQNRLLRKLRVGSPCDPAPAEFECVLNRALGLPNQSLCLFCPAANHFRVRHACRTAGSRAGRNARQTQQHLQSIRRETAGGRAEESAQQRDGQAGRGTGSTGTTTRAGRSLAVRAAAAHHRRYTDASGEDDPGTAARVHPADAEVFDRAWKAGLGQRLDPATLVAKGAALGQRPHGCAHGGRKAKGKQGNYSQRLHLVAGGSKGKQSGGY